MVVSICNAKVILIKRIGKAAFVNHWKIHLSICDDYHTLGCSRLVFGVTLICSELSMTCGQ